ncbi:MAG: hypothetical protein LIP09_00695 [Bacteroidales bacterium]|nr:hypothetical protein [Bacteroidales bacterium]
MEETNNPMPAKATELELMTKQAEAQFALSPIGQMSRQFELVQKMGDYYAQSTVLPAIYQKNPANCAIAINMAARMGADPLMVMQNLYIVHGNPAWSSKFLIGCINTCGRFQPLEYEGNGKAVKDPGFAIRCVGYAKSDTQKKAPLKGTWITWDMVNSEGWSSKPGSKWKTMPEQMFRYRAAAFWQRTYAPEISMGLMTQEEAEDAGRQVVDTGYVEIRENTLRGEAIDPNPFGGDSPDPAPGESESKDPEPAATTPTPGKIPTPPTAQAPEPQAQPSGRTPDF